MSYERVRCWLAKAEQLANLSKQVGGSDLAAAGGWKSEAVLLRHYQQPDEATLLRVLTGGVELREPQA